MKIHQRIKMKFFKTLFFIAIVLFGVQLYADKSKYEYSYFTAALQTMDFQTDLRMSDGTTYHSEATTNNPVYMTGALYNMIGDFALSYEIATTLVPISTDETFYKNGLQIQTEDTQMFNNSIEVLGQYKLTDNHRLVAGGTYSLNFWKRYNFSTDPNSYYIIEQRDLSVMVSAGYWYEAFYLDSKLHTNFRALGSVPLWSETENTGEDVTFSNREGYQLSLSLHVGYDLFSDKELGLLLRYSHTYRERAHSYSTKRAREVYVPEEKIGNTYIGLYYLF